MRRTAKLILGIWDFASVVLIGVGVTGLYGGLFLIFFGIGLVLVLFGFDLDAVDRWLDAHGAWFEWFGLLLFRLVLAMILIACLYAVGKGIYDRLPLPGRPRRQRAPAVPRPRGKRKAASALSSRDMVRAKGAPRLSESGVELPGEGGAGMEAYNPDEAANHKPMGWGAMIVALIVSYFCYVGATMHY